MKMEEIFVEIQKAADTIATPNWADELSLLLSLLAIAVAGYVAWKQAKISEQQNKIALFEKRYVVYENVSKVVNAAEEIFKVENTDDIWDVFQNVFDMWPGKELEDINAWRMSLIFSINEKLDQAEFLFSKDISEAVSFVQIELLLLLRGTYAEFDIETFEKRKLLLYDTAQNLKSKHILERMKKDLQLQSIIR